MDYKSLLNLHLSQTEIFVEKSKNNSYSDQDKKNYQLNLNKLFKEIKSSIAGEINDSFIFEKQEHLRFICASLEFLKDSTLNSMPFEVVGCLNLAMKEWIDQEFIIVTSLNNNIDAFSYDPNLALEDLLYQSIEIQYGILFEKRLVQINLPLILSRDYFSSVVLYHELGHFIDLKYAISQKVALKLTTMTEEEFAKYKPYLSYGKSNEWILESHIAEYFCDTFASQYIGSTSNYYLQYITKNSSESAPTHPSTVNRVQVVDDFISGNKNPILELLTQYTKDLSGRDLKKRYEDITHEDFFKFIPLQIESKEQLHGVFPYAWNIWMDGVEQFKSKAGITSDFTADKTYKVLNNLIEKSIGNYFIEQSWGNSKI